MKKIILMLAILISSINANYIEGNTIGIPGSSPTQQNPVIFLNTATGIGSAWNVWTKVDLTNIVPAGTKAVRLDGYLIITHGITPEIADLMVHFRKTGDTSFPYSYIMQAIEVDTKGGQRSTAGTWIVLDDDLTFEYKWNVNQLGTYPNYSSYGINLSITAYLR